MVSEPIPEIMNQNLYFNKILSQFICTLKFNKHCSRAHIFLSFDLKIKHTLLAISEFFCILSPSFCFSVSSRGKDFLLCSTAKLPIYTPVFLTHSQPLFRNINSLPLSLSNMLTGTKSYVFCIFSIYHSTRPRVGMFNS